MKVSATAATEIGSLVDALRAAWSAETSSDLTWTPTVPSRGQCAVTALIVQDLYGGDLLRAEVDGCSHYWNRLQDREVDLTRDQFQRFEPSEIETRSREYVLSFPDTAERYRQLRERLGLTIVGKPRVSNR